MSSYNTPILPVRKADDSYCKVQDLWTINQIVKTKNPVVPTPDTLLNKVPFDHQWFNVILF